MKKYILKFRARFRPSDWAARHMWCEQLARDAGSAGWTEWNSGGRFRLR